MKSAPFFSRAIIGLAIDAKPGIKGHWYPRTPSTFLRSFRLQGIWGQSAIAESLSGAIVMPAGVSLNPRKSISVTSKRHFDGFKNREFFRRMAKKSRVIRL